jgi:general secretion pathway protein L
LNTLYLRLPSRHTHEWLAQPLAYAICSQAGAVISEGHSPLAQLAASIAKCHVVLIVAAVDVTILELTLPPMPEAKLKLALPNLVEDQLMADPQACVLALGAKLADAPNKRSVMAVQRSWLQQVSSSLMALGANSLQAAPAQFCLPVKKEGCSAYLDRQDQTTSLTLRFDAQRGVGVQLEAGLQAQDYLTTLAWLALPGSIELHVSAQLTHEYQTAIEADPAWKDRFSLREANWLNIGQALQSEKVDLLTGSNPAKTYRIQWQYWRWPVVLATLMLIINLASLNYDYWTLKREAQALKQGIVEIYKKAAPNDTVVLFPLEQMRKKLDAAKRNSGQASPDDFTLLLTQFGSVWQAMNPAQLPKLVSIEYKERALLVQVKGAMPQTELESKLGAQGLALKKIKDELWQVGRAK